MNKKFYYVLIAFLCVAIVLCSVLIPLYFSGIIGKEPNKGPAKPQTEDPFRDFTFKSVTTNSNSLPSGEYADFTIVYKSKEYTVKVYLLSKYAPKTVENFVKYAKAGLYDNTVFYRADITYYEDTGKPSSAYIQGGAYAVDDEGGLIKKTPDPYYGKLEGEFLLNDPKTENNVSFTAGILGMVREMDDYNSADTEFFFLSYAHTEFDGYYAAFGVVLESDDTSDLYTFTEALCAADGEYPVTIKSVNIYSYTKK